MKIIIVLSIAFFITIALTAISVIDIHSHASVNTFGPMAIAFVCIANAIHLYGKYLNL